MKYLKVFTDFADVIEPLGDAETGRLFKAMLEYTKTGTEPDFRGNERFIWTVAKQNIDRTVAFFDKQKTNGMHGGRPKTEKPKETQNNPNKPKQTQENPAKAYKEKDKEKDKDKEIFIYPPTPFVPSLQQAFYRWLDYKRERKENYKETGLKSLISQIEKHERQYGTTAVVEIIEYSMANNWKGIIFDRLKNGRQPSGNVFMEIAKDEGLI